MRDVKAIPEVPDPGGERTVLSAEEVFNGAVEMVVSDEHEKRMWVRTLGQFLASRSHDSDPSGRVQFAYDQAYIAACEAVKRLFDSMMPPVTEES